MNRKSLRFLMFKAALLVALAGCSSPTTESPRSTTTTTSAAPQALRTQPTALSICSFNIQFLGSSAKRDNGALADLVSRFDIVVVQELIAAPASSPTDKPESRQHAAAFFREMTSRGYAFVISESDTGRTGPLNNYSTATEWWVTFYRPQKVAPALDLPHGFISSPLAANADFDRVPYAFAFRTPDKHCDFVLVSVHLNPDDKSRRAHELATIWSWITTERARQEERDFVVLGDTNVQNQAELHADTPANFISLNDACVPTNVNPAGPKPYDQVFFDPRFTSEIDRTFGFKVVNLVEEMRSKWRGPGAYPGDPFQQNVFRFYYSDHDPVHFRITVPERDDD